MTQYLRKWLKYNFKSTHTRLLFILTAAVCSIIVIVGMVSYYTSKLVLQQELSEPQHQMLRLGMNYIDDYVEESNHLATRMALNYRVYGFLNGQQSVSYHNMNELLRFLENMVNSTTYIKSAYIYDVTADRFAAFPQGYSSSSINFPDAGWTDVADEFGEQMMLVKRHESANGEASISMYRKVLIRGEFKGIIALNLKTDQIFSHMQMPEVSDLDSQRFVLDGQGHVMYAIGPHQFGAEAAVAAMDTLGGKQIGEFNYNDSRLLATHLQSPITGWNYISVVSQDSLLASVTKIRNVVMLVSVAALIAGAAAIGYFNRMAFKPVRRMRQLFSNYEHNRISPDLIDLEKITGELLTDHAQLSLHLRQTIPEASSKFLSDLYTGSMNGSREIHEKWARYFSHWNDQPVTVFMMSIDDYPIWTEQFARTDHSLLKFALINITAELLGEQRKVIAADLGHDRIIFMVQSVTGDAEHNFDLRQTLQSDIEMITCLLKFSVSIGISSSQSDIIQLRQTMAAAENALSYRLYRGMGQAISYEELAEYEAVSGRIEEAACYAQLREIMESGQTVQALERMEEVIEQIRSEYWYPSSAYIFLEKIAARLDIQLQKPLAEFSAAAEKINLHTLSLDRIHEYLRQGIMRVTSRYEGLSQSKDYRLCQRMIEYMENHLDDPVSVQEIAEHTGISVSLASQLFKQEMNETIHSYFTKLRMERACELLLGTEHKVAEIASMVGYQHENSFIRVYRKYKNMTPGKYREMMRSRKPSLLE